MTADHSQVESEAKEVKVEEKPPITMQVKSISLTGLMALEYSRAIVPVNYTSFDWHNETQFRLLFEQRSDERN